MSNSLYAISTEMEEFLIFLAEEEISLEEGADQFEALKMELDDKLDNYGYIIRNIESRIAARKTEIERMRELNRKDENSIRRLKESVKYNMDRVGVKKGGKIFSLSVRNTAPAVEIVDGSKIPEKFYQIMKEKKLDKKSLNDAVKENPDAFAGICKVERKKIVVIK